jgi:hypothetical protein
LWSQSCFKAHGCALRWGQGYVDDVVWIIAAHEGEERGDDVDGEGEADEDDGPVAVGDGADDGGDWRAGHVLVRQLKEKRSMYAAYCRSLMLEVRLFP